MAQYAGDFRRHRRLHRRGDCGRCGWDSCDESTRCQKKSHLQVQAQREFGLDLSRTYFIGDDERDAQAAEAAACPWLMVSEKTSLLELTRQLVNGDFHPASVAVQDGGRAVAETN